MLSNPWLPYQSSQARQIISTSEWSSTRNQIQRGYASLFALPNYKKLRIVYSVCLELGRGRLELRALMISMDVSVNAYLVDGRPELLYGSSQELLLLLVDLTDREDFLDTASLPISTHPTPDF